MRLSALSTILAALVLLGGCARVKVTTEIKSDGSVNRTIAFTGQEKKENTLQMGGTIEEAFVLPAGKEWKSRETKKEADRHQRRLYQRWC
jgi:predicted ATPase